MRTRILPALVFPAVVLGAVGVAAGLSTTGLGLARSWAITALLATVAVAAVEWWMPRSTDLRLTSDPQTVRDVGHWIVVSRVGAPFGAFVVAVGMASVVDLHDGRLWEGWPTEWPLAAQAMTAWLALGFVDYWIHRAYHSLDLLWWVHALHHDAEGLHVLKAGRVHLAEGFVNGAAAAGLVVLGVPHAVVAVVLAVNAVLGALAHANLEQRLWDPLHWLVPNVNLHRIHHARERGLHDTNLGIPLYDLAFGTYTSPRSCPDPQLGAADPEAPATFTGQLLYPLRRWSGAARPGTGT